MTALDAQAGLGYTCLAHRCALPILNFPKLLVTIERKSRLSGYHQPFQVAAVPPPHTPPRLQPCQADPREAEMQQPEAEPRTTQGAGETCGGSTGTPWGGGVLKHSVSRTFAKHQNVPAIKLRKATHSTHRVHAQSSLFIPKTSQSKQGKAPEQPGAGIPGKSHQPSKVRATNCCYFHLVANGHPQMSYKPQVSSVQNNNRQEKFYFGG